MSKGSLRPAMWKVDAAAAAIGAAGAAAAWFGGVHPMLNAGLEQEAKRASLAPQVQRRDSLTAVLNQLEAERVAVATELAARPLTLEPVSHLNQRVMALTELAARLGLAGDQFTSGDPRQGPDTVSVPIRMTGSGTFPECNAFLRGLALEFPDMSVTGFQLAGNPNDPEGRASFVFDLAWYAVSDGAALGQSASVPLR